MTKPTPKLPMTFHHFEWAIGFFCFPITLYPVAIMLSVNFMENPTLSAFSVRLMTIYFWIYPVILAIFARLLYRLHKRKPRLAYWGLGISIVGFYISVYIILRVGLIYVG